MPCKLAGSRHHALYEIISYLQQHLWQNKDNNSLMSTEQLKLCRKHENERSEASISKAFATIAVLKSFLTLGHRSRHRWLKAAANMRIQKCKMNQPSPPWTKGHQSVKNPKLALSTAPAMDWYLLPPHLHPAARLDPPHAPGPAVSSWLKPECVGEEE